MVKVLFLVLCFSFVFGNDLSNNQNALNSAEQTQLSKHSILQGVIINIIGQNSYNRNKSFINKLFVNTESFYQNDLLQNGNLDVYKVISTLQNNGLLKLKFSKPQEFNVIFISKTSPIFLLRSINKSLSYMGYSYWTTSEAIYQDDISKLKISLVTEHIIDPIALLNELSKNGFFALNIIRNYDNEWEYTLSIVNSKLPDSSFIAKGNSVSISEINGEYWLELSSDSGKLEISTQNYRSFNPKIIFFDKDLNILDVQIFSKRNNVNVGISKHTKFVQIKDSIFSLNLKDGVNIRFR